MRHTDVGQGVRRRLGQPAVVLVVVLILTAVLVVVAQSVYTRNENRLLKLRAKDASTILTASLPDLQTTLASAAELADATNGDVARFEHFIAPYVGTTGGFVSASLWRVSDPAAGPMADVGSPPLLAASATTIQSYFARLSRARTLGVIGFLSGPSKRLGYGFVTPGSSRRFAVYAESTVPTARQARIQGSSTFSDLNYALYLGRSQDPTNLVLASVSRLPFRGRHTTVTVAFGDSALTLVLAPRSALSGSLPRDLPWIIAVGGVLLALVGAAVTSRLIGRRRDAEQLAVRLEAAALENQRLYAEQRDIAQTLQQSLLPDKLPEFDGIEASAVYKAGEHGVDIGGDWYDLISLADRRMLLVVGDVSGRGLHAATTMAALRYAIHAYAAQDDSPAAILGKLSKLVSIEETGQLATVLCVLVDIDHRRLTASSAGHLPPLLIANGHSDYVRSDVGVPIGVQPASAYASTTITVPDAATVLAFTDGLVERRGEDLETGLARLRDAATSTQSDLDGLLEGLVSKLHGERSHDDSAILGLRWRT